jgi:uncharacterized membrane protein YphA (DoxX/SURF4 family)
MKKAQLILAWTILMLTAFLFTAIGFSKLAGPSSLRWGERFAHWGYPVALCYVVGGLESLCGIGLIIPVATRPAAAALMGVMAGACYTHLIHGELLRVVPPMVLGTFALLIFLWRHPLTVRRRSNLKLQES